MSADDIHTGPTQLSGTAASGSSATGADDVRLGRGESVGQYLVLDFIAQGGMGAVFSAYHPDLNRRVALKVLRTQSDEHSGPSVRLLREAQAMARLSHPNVVTVFDVGVSQGRMFVAMEFVEGTTLRDWETKEPRPWRQVLDVFLQAGRGLAAAHRAGLIHRDFKPHNVLISADGRVRVTDFGLARAAQGAPTPEPAPERLPSSDSLDLDVTLAGSIMGTPGYMAPEQALGNSLDARTDQFGFFASLFQGLYGELPYGERLAFSSKAVPTAEKPGSSVPKRLRKVVLRGLALRPADRFPNMDDALAALSRAAVPRYRRWGLAIAGAVLALLVVAGTRWAKERSERCTREAAQVDSAWNTTRRLAIQGTFLAADAVRARDFSARLNRLFDAYADAWKEARVRACALEVDAPAQATVAAECLEERLATFRALTDTLTRADPRMFVTSLVAAASLPEAAGCLDPRQVKTAFRRQQGDLDGALRRKIAELGAQLIAGYKDATFAGAQVLVAEARQQHDDLALEQALYLEGYGLSNGKNTRQSLDILEEADLTAERVGDDWARVRVATQMASAHYFLNEPAAAETWLRRGQARLDRFGGEDGLQVSLLTVWGVVAELADRQDEAVAIGRRAVAMAKHLYGNDHPKTLRALGNLGVTLYNSDRFEESLEVHREELGGNLRFFGPDHPETRTAAVRVADAQAAMGRWAEARPVIEENFKRLETDLGPDKVPVADAAMSLAEVLRQSGDLEGALQRIHQAEQIQERVGAKAWLMDEMCVEVEVLRALGRRSQAHALVTRLQAMAKDSDVEATERALTALAAAELAVEDKDPARAMAQSQLGLTALAGRADKTVAGARLKTAAAEAALALGKPQEARSLATAAVEYRESRQLPKAEGAVAKLALAESMWATPADHARARVLAQEALGDLAEAPPFLVPVRGRAEKWLQGHR